MTSDRFGELRSGDIRKMKASLARLGECRTWQEAGMQSVDEMMRIIDSDNPCYNRFSRDYKEFLDYYLPEEYVDASLKCMHAVNTFMPFHPVLSVKGWDGLQFGTNKMSDYISDRELIDNPLYHEAYRHIDARYQLSKLIGKYGDSAIVIAVNRKDKDFTLREAQITEVYFIHLKIVFTQLHERIKLQDCLSSLVGKFSAAFPENALLQITSRELEVLNGHLVGMRSCDIATHRNVKENTIHKQTQSICEKLGVSSVGKLKSLFKQSTMHSNGSR